MWIKLILWPNEEFFKFEYKVSQNVTITQTKGKHELDMSYTEMNLVTWQS